MLFSALWIGCTVLAYVLFLGLGSLIGDAVYVFGAFLAIGALLAAVFSSYYTLVEKLNTLEKKLDALTPPAEQKEKAVAFENSEEQKQKEEDRT